MNEEIKTFLMGFVVACSMYSKIPMPQLPWSDKNMKYAICFFPMVGVAIGIVFCAWYTCCQYYLHPSELTRVCIAAVIPLIITGGIHVDGFMDTSDALHSYQPRERKLEILKDSHVGAFAVIMLLLYAVSGIGLLALVQETWQITMMALGFVMSRCLSGLSVVSFQNAKKEGTLYAFSSQAHRSVVRGILALEWIVCAALMVFIKPITGIAVVVVTLIWFYLYYKKSKQEFGGITGDLAGWFLCICEWVICLIIGVVR